MKKISLLFLLAFSFIIRSQAQEFEFALKAGTDLEKLTGAKFTDGFAFGYHAGVYAVVPLNKKWSVQPELYYSSATANKADNIGAIYDTLNLNGISKINFSYINVPILLTYKHGKSFAIQAGPKYSMLSSSNLTVLDNAKNAFSNGDFSLVGGVQIYFKKLRIYGRYEIGLTNVNEVIDEDKWKRQSAHLGVAFKLF